MTTRYAVAAWMLDLGPSGVRTRLSALLRALPALLADDEELVVLHGPSAPLVQHPRQRWVRLAVPAQPTWRRALAERRLLPRCLRQLGADLLHLETLPVPARLPCPVVLTVHDLRDLGPYARRTPALFRHVLRRSAARAAALVAPSAATARTLTAALPGREVAVVPGTFDAVLPGEAPSAWAGALVHVGHLEPRKDLGTLLAAYARARARAALPPLVLAGRDSGSRAALERQAAALAVGAHVHCVGSLDDATLAALYRDAGAVLVPSREEGFGLPALEALAAGVPVFVSDAGALPEVVGRAGTIVAAGDVDAWTAALLRWAQTPDDPAARAARRARATQFAPPRVAAELLAVWRAVAGRT